MTRVRKHVLAVALAAALISLAGCATHPWEHERAAEKWIESTVVPIQKSQPQQAIALLQKRLNEECAPIEGLGKMSFWQMKGYNGESGNHRACALYSAQLAMVLYQSGQFREAVPYMSQALLDKASRVPGTTPPLNGMLCESMSWYGVRDPQVRSAPLFVAYFDTMEKAGDARARDFMYKSYLCRLDVDYGASPTALEDEFVMRTRAYYGEDAAQKSQQYITVIHRKLKPARFALQSQPYTPQRLAKDAELLNNAIAQVRRQGLDAPIGTMPSPYPLHLQALMADKERALRTNATNEAYK